MQIWLLRLSAVLAIAVMGSFGAFADSGRADAVADSSIQCWTVCIPVECWTVCVPGDSVSPGSLETRDYWDASRSVT